MSEQEPARGATGGHTPQGSSCSVQAAMRDVRARYAEPHDPRHPTLCLDEMAVVPHADVRPSLRLSPGHPERRDDEFARRGTANLFVRVGPMTGWRRVR